MENGLEYFIIIKKIIITLFSIKSD